MGGLANLGSAARKAVTKNKAKHTENGGYIKSDAYKKEKAELKEKQGTLSKEEDYDKQKAELRDRHANLGEGGKSGYFKSAAYSAGKAEAVEKKGIVERAVNNPWFTVVTTTAMVAPMALPLFQGKDDQGQDQGQPDPNAGMTTQVG